MKSLLTTLLYACALILGASDACATITPLTLPKVWDAADGKAAYTAELGCSSKGLGSDYASAPKIKFDNTDDYLMIQLASAPDTLGFDIKGNKVAGACSFKVQESVNGTAFTDALTLTSVAGTASRKSVKLQSATRYIRFLYANKDTGNVALGGVAISKLVGSDPDVSLGDAVIDFGVVYQNAMVEPLSVMAYLSNVTSATAAVTGTQFLISPTTLTQNTSITISAATTSVLGSFCDTLTLAAIGAKTAKAAVKMTVVPAPQTGTFAKVTGALEEGDYIIVDTKAAQALKAEISSSRFVHAAVTFTQSDVVNPDSALVWHIAPQGAYWTMYSAYVSRYAGAGTLNTGSLLKADTAAAAKWQISYVENQYVVENLGRMQAENTPENHYLRHGSNGWAAYSATYGAAPEFYAYVVPSSLTTPAAPAEDGVEKVLIDGHLYIRHRDHLYDVTGRVR